MQSLKSGEPCAWWICNWKDLPRHHRKGRSPWRCCEIFGEWASDGVLAIRKDLASEAMLREPPWLLPSQEQSRRTVAAKFAKLPDIQRWLDMEPSVFYVAAYDGPSSAWLRLLYFKPVCKPKPLVALQYGYYRLVLRCLGKAQARLVTAGHYKGRLIGFFRDELCAFLPIVLNPPDLEQHRKS